jgi:pimeloyl-ACP methyl ester carboxylesterase
MRSFIVNVLLAFGLGTLIGYIYKFFRRPKKVKFIGFAPSQYVKIKDGNIHYVQAGSGPDIVLIHGIGASHYCWKSVFTHLSKDFRVTAIDLLGFGQSDKNINVEYDLDSQTDRLLECLDQLKIHKFYLAGCSMGGAISLWLAKKQPESVEKLIVISPATNPRLVFINPNWLWPAVHILKNFLVTPVFVRFIHNLTIANRKSATPDEIFQYYVPYHKNPDAVVCFWKANKSLQDSRLPNELKDLQTKTLILYGKQDRLVPRRYMQDLSRILPHAELVIHLDGGHHLMVDKPVFVSSEIRKFIGTT